MKTPHNSQNKVAAVFGATGLVGKELVKLLIEDDTYSKVKLITRREITLTNPKAEIILLEDFSQLLSVESKIAADVYFICTGTTIKKAGTKVNFRKTDYELPVTIAKCAQKLNVKQMVIISSIGANISSSNFYLHTKGEMEQGVTKEYTGVLNFIRPSLLLGEREESRTGEHIASLIMRLVGWVMIGPLKSYRGVNAAEVARQMVAFTK
ncbi:MAG: NAD(P)H-binding protein [Bacteroidales bacterium]|nr:NAD(P)H-binding protein [Bacteroidales bacterium]